MSIYSREASPEKVSNLLLATQLVNGKAGCKCRESRLEQFFTCASWVDFMVNLDRREKLTAF